MKEYQQNFKVRHQDKVCEVCGNQLKNNQCVDCKHVNALLDAFLQGYEAGYSLKTKPTREDILKLFIGSGKELIAIK